MKDRTPLQLMEQVAMTAVFALCAAMCLQAFAAAYNISKRSQLREAACSLADAVCAASESGTGIAPEGTDAEVFVDAGGRPCDRDGACYKIVIRWNDVSPLPAASMDVDVTSPDGLVPYASRTAVWQKDMA